jgi:hypothetical protein
MPVSLLLLFINIHKPLICFRISKVNKDEVLSKAENDLATVVNQYIGKLVKELHGTDFWKLRRAYTFGVSTALTLLCFLIIFLFFRELVCLYLVLDPIVFCEYVTDPICLDVSVCRYKNMSKLQHFVDFATLALY